jgi:anti-anti-sigma factor
MRIQHTRHDKSIVLSLTGHLNARAVPTVRRALFTALAARPAAVICDLAGLDSLDPASASVFASATHPASGWPSAKLLLCGARPVVAAILAERAVPEFLPVYATLDQALQQTRQRPSPRDAPPVRWTPRWPDRRRPRIGSRRAAPGPVVRPGRCPDSP